VAFRDSRYVARTNDVSEKISLALETGVPSTSTSTSCTQLTGALRAEKDRSVDRGLNERTRAVLEVLEETFTDKVSISFDEMTSGVSKRSAASAFLEVLQLKSRGLIDAAQEEPFGVITLMAREQ
jgi:chromatin segregation and condensation protein Rec8/ScpA/Scc1 (kleisin family)